MTIRAIIVDDMELARHRLVRQLAKHSDVEIVGQCANGQEAIDAIDAVEPDLVFLDVQMPELDGFGVVEKLQGKRVPEIIFVTAFDQFAIKAFDVHAADYLLKPFSPDRLEKALSRVRGRISDGAHGEGLNVTALLRSLNRQFERAKPLIIRVDGSTLLLRQAEIDWIESAGNYVKVHAGKERYMVRETMADFAARLDAQNFVRVHRSVIVNVSRIREIRSPANGIQEIVLRDGQAVPMSRGFRQRLSEIFDGL